MSHIVPTLLDVSYVIENTVSIRNNFELQRALESDLESDLESERKRYMPVVIVDNNRVQSIPDFLIEDIKRRGEKHKKSKNVEVFLLPEKLFEELFTCASPHRYSNIISWGINLN